MCGTGLNSVRQNRVRKTQYPVFHPRHAKRGQDGTDFVVPRVVCPEWGPAVFAWEDPGVGAYPVVSLVRNRASLIVVSIRHGFFSVVMFNAGAVRRTEVPGAGQPDI